MSEAASSRPEGQALPDGTVTVLFTDLVESTHLNQQLGDDTARAICREVEQRAVELVERHKGVVVKGLGDGLMVAFSSARRAVSCAREIQLAAAARNRKNPLQRVVMRIGLHTGEVIEETGDLHGETVIIAKRIEGVAPAGGIYVSETVRGVLGTTRAELVDRGEFELKGIDVPWRLFEVPVPVERDDAAVADSERSPFVGRARELGLLAEKIERAATGRGGMVLVTGEAGAGKSRLVQEAAAVARAHDIGVLVGHCLDMDAAPPYQPLVEQLEQAARALPTPAFRELLGENAPEVARLMPELHRLYDDVGESPRLPPEQERRYLLHGFGRFVERAARRQPLVLCFEDLHWADDASLLLIASIADLAGELPLLIIGTYRPGDVALGESFARMLEELMRHRLATEIRVGALTEAQVGLLLAGRAGRTPPAELVSLVYDETEGNPFFVEEMFLHLRERDALFDENGSWRTGVALADTEVPRTVRLVIERRLERVGDDVRKALIVAAVIGRTASIELLIATLGLDEDALIDTLDEAEHANLIEGQNRGREVIYGFVHEQIRQTLLADLSAARRQRLHLRVADTMEALLGTRVEERAAEVAHHLQLAGTAAAPHRTAHYLEVAARNAITAIAPEDAMRHVDAALVLCEDADAPRAASLLALRAQARRAVGDIEEALTDLAAALELAPAGPDHDVILGQRAGLHLDLFDGAAAAADLTTVLESARARSDRDAELDTLLALGRAYYVQALDDPAHAQRSLVIYEKAYTLAVSLGNRRAMADALLPTAWFTDFWPGYHETAKANVAEAQRIADELGDERLSIEAGTAELRFSYGAEVTERSERLRERLEARHDPVRLKEHYFWLMWHYLFRGQIERCVETCDLGLAVAGQLGSAPVQYGSIKAQALSELGRYDLVDAALAEEVTDDAHPFGQANQAFARALHLGSLEAWEPAAAAALDAMQRGVSLSRVWIQQGMLSLAVTLAAKAGDALRTTTTAIAGMADAELRPSALARAEKRLAAGEPRQAVDRIAAAIEAFEANRLDRDLGWALECLARAYSGLDEHDAALAAADRALALPTTAARLPLTWRLRGCRAHALDRLGRVDEATAERALALADFDTLAERIIDSNLRQWFVRQPLATRWLEPAAHTTRRDAPR